MFSCSCGREPSILPSASWSAAKRFFLKLLTGLRYVQRVIIIDKLGSY